MIWQLFFGVVALCLNNAVAQREFCEVTHDDYLTFGRCTDQDLCQRALGAVRKYICNYGKMNPNNGRCSIQPQCISERQALMGNLTNCVNQLSSSGVPALTWPDNYLAEMGLYELSKARTYFWESGLPHLVEVGGAKRNGQIDRIEPFIPVIYLLVVEHFISLAPDAFSFPLPNELNVKDMIVNILQLSCGSQFSSEQRLGLKDTLTNEKITKFALDFLDGPEANLKTRQAYYKLKFRFQDDGTKLKNWWRQLLKPSDNQHEAVMPGCLTPSMVSSRDQSITSHLKQFVNNIKAEHVANFRLHGIVCQDTGTMFSCGGGGGGGGSSSDTFHSVTSIGRGQGVGRLAQFFSQHITSHAQGDSNIGLQQP